MAKKRKEPAPTDKGSEVIEANVHQAIRSLGWAVPECEQDVRRAEAELSASATPLPESLGDAAAVFEGKTDGGVANVSLAEFGTDAQVEENLARAARQGGKIPPEIEQRMRRDREDAERKLSQDEDGEDIG